MASRIGRVVLRIGSLGVAAGVGAAVYTLWTLPNQVGKEQFYERTVATLRGYQDGVDMLGEPIRDVTPRFTSSTTAYSPSSADQTWTDGHIARLAIKVEGRKTNGTLHSWCRKIADEWTVDKCDLEVDSRRWTFYINPQSQDVFGPSGDDPASTDFPRQWYGTTTAAVTANTANIASATNATATTPS